MDLTNMLAALPSWMSGTPAQAGWIFLASLLLAGLADVLVRRVVSNLAGRTVTELDDQIVDALHRPVALTWILVGAGLAIQLLIPDTTAEWVLEGLLVTAGVLLWAVGLSGVARAVLAHLGKLQQTSRYVQPRTLPVFDIAVKAVILGGASYFLLLAWDVDVTGWLASAGIVGIAVGFAAKDTLANLFAGVFIIADAPYKLGDYLVLDSGECGMVTGIGIRSTRILTRDGVEIIVPNSTMANTKIVNQSGGPVEATRVRVPVGVAYGSDVRQVREVLLEVARQTPEVVVDDPERAPRVRFRSLDDSCLSFEVLAWAQTPGARGRVVDRLLMDTVIRFEAEGIDIPFPQRVVRVVQEDSRE